MSSVAAATIVINGNEDDDCVLLSPERAPVPKRRKNMLRYAPKSARKTAEQIQKDLSRLPVETRTASEASLSDDDAPSPKRSKTINYTGYVQRWAAERKQDREAAAQTKEQRKTDRLRRYTGPCIAFEDFYWMYKPLAVTDGCRIKCRGEQVNLWSLDEALQHIVYRSLSGVEVDWGLDATQQYASVKEAVTKYQEALGKVDSSTIDPAVDLDTLKQAAFDFAEAKVEQDHFRESVAEARAAFEKHREVAMKIKELYAQAVSAYRAAVRANTTYHEARQQLFKESKFPTKQLLWRGELCVCGEHDFDSYPHDRTEGPICVHEIRSYDTLYMTEPEDCRTSSDSDD